MPVFSGKIYELPRIEKCPVCGSKPILRRDSTKRFQVWCSCGCRTGWKTKPEAIIDWYNLILAMKAKVMPTQTHPSEEE